MKKYLAVFLGSPEAMDAWKALPEAELKEKQKAGMEGWMKWATDNAASIVDGGGAPLGKTKKVTKEGITDTRNEMGAFTIVQAESQDEAAKLFLNHPHFTLFPGHSVEVMECLEIPKMQN